MDLKSIKPHDWLLAGAGAVMLIFGLALNWASVTVGGVSRSGNGPFDYFITGGLAWLLVVATGVVAFLVAARIIAADTAPWNLIFLGSTGLAAVLMLLRLIMGGGSQSGVDLDRGAGMYVAFIAAAAALGGAIWRYIDSGGDLKDLTNADKLKSSFKRAD